MRCDGATPLSDPCAFPTIPRRRSINQRTDDTPDGYEPSTGAAHGRPDRAPADHAPPGVQHHDERPRGLCGGCRDMQYRASLSLSFPYFLSLNTRALTLGHETHMIPGDRVHVHMAAHPKEQGRGLQGRRTGESVCAVGECGACGGGDEGASRGSRTITIPMLA